MASFERNPIVPIREKLGVFTCFHVPLAGVAAPVPGEAVDAAAADQESQGQAADDGTAAATAT